MRSPGVQCRGLDGAVLHQHAQQVTRGPSRNSKACIRPTRQLQAVWHTAALHSTGHGPQHNTAYGRELERSPASLGCLVSSLTFVLCTLLLGGSREQGHCLVSILAFLWWGLHGAASSTIFVDNSFKLKLMPSYLVSSGPRDFIRVYFGGSASL
jgi:hypothetical protein